VFSSFWSVAAVRVRWWSCTIRVKVRMIILSAGSDPNQIEVDSLLCEQTRIPDRSEESWCRPKQARAYGLLVLHLAPLPGRW
jgi:hypothetical protein